MASHLCLQCKKYHKKRKTLISNSKINERKIIKKEKMNYKKICTICKKEFITGYKGKNICSKLCRKSIKRNKKYYKCMICNWDATIDTHHENGAEYAFCPNHHSLLTRGKKTLEEVLKGSLYSLRQIKDSNYSTIEVTKEPKIFINFYKKLKESDIEYFQYKDIMSATNWKYEKVKKYILGLVKLGKIKYVIKDKWGTRGGRGKRINFELA